VTVSVEEAGDDEPEMPLPPLPVTEVVVGVVPGELMDYLGDEETAEEDEDTVDACVAALERALSAAYPDAEITIIVDAIGGATPAQVLRGDELDPNEVWSVDEIVNSVVS